MDHNKRITSVVYKRYAAISLPQEIANYKDGLSPHHKNKGHNFQKMNINKCMPISPSKKYLKQVNLMCTDQTLLIHNGIKTQVVKNNLKNDNKKK